MRRLLLAALLVPAAASAARAAGPAQSPWPMYLGNAQHTSSTTYSAPAKPQLQFFKTIGVSNLSSGYSVSIGPDGALYVPSVASGNNYQVVALNPDGTTKWTFPLGLISASQPAVSDDGQVYVSSTASLSSQTIAVSLSTSVGSVNWSNQTCGYYGLAASPTVGPDGTQYYGSAESGGGSVISCYTAIPSTGTRRWFAVQGSPFLAGALSPDGATVYAPTNSGSETLYSYAAADGTPGWSVGGSGLNGSVSVGASGALYFNTGSDLKAFSPAGSLLWTALGAAGDTPPAATGNLVFTHHGSTVTAFDATSGAVVWNFDLCASTTGVVLTGTPFGCGGVMAGAYAPSAGPVSIGGSTAFFAFDNVYPPSGTSSNPGTPETYLVAVDTGTGAKKWALPLPQSMSLGVVVPAGNDLYYSDGYRIVAFSSSAASQFSVSVSSFVLVPGSSVTFTATVLDATSNPVPDIPVQFEVLGSSMAPALSTGTTDGSGHFSVSFTSSSLNSSVQQATVTVRATSLDFAPVDNNVFMEGEAIDHLSVVVPTTTPIGVPFAMSVYARNAYDHGLPSFPGTSGPVTVNLSPYLNGTLVAGSGSLGQTSVGISNGTGTITSQTYNKIESIQIKAAQQSPGTAVGLSTTVVVTGPDGFVVTIPTGIPAGQSFPVTITAVSGSTQVAGYSATLSLSAVVWNSTNTAATGSLSVASVNMPPTGSVTINNESFSAGGGIALKVVDSSLGIQSVSSTMTVTTPALTIDHYSISVPTQVTVGRSFSFEADALDASSAPVSYSLPRTLNVQAFLSGTSIAGSGSAGVTTLTLTAGTTYSYTASQTYNKIESVQFRVTDDDGRTGLSSPVVFSGPTQFVVTVPTAAQAGSQFQFVVQAQDGGGSQVLGYDGTVSISAVDASTPSAAGGGTLGVTGLTLAAGSGSSSFQSYTKAQGIRFKVSDSGVGVTSVSSSMTIVAGAPSSLAVAANPQSIVASVPSVLTATALDAYSNPIAGSTVTFSVISGSGVVSLGLVSGSLPAADGVSSTQAVTGAAGTAQSFFGSTNTASAMAEVVRAQTGGLTTDTTIYSAVLLTTAGGTIVNAGDPSLRVDCPANTWAFPVRMTLQGRSELSAADLALATAAFAAAPNTFVSTDILKVAAVRDSDPNTAAGKGRELLSVSMPFTAAGSSVTVGSLRGQSLLVPLSVLRVFKLNQQTSVFEMLLDGDNLVNLSSSVVVGQVYDPDGIYAVGAPPYATLSAGSSATVVTPLSGGATATVSVPFGAFGTATTLTAVSMSASSLASLPPLPGLSPTGIAISINTGGIQPAVPVGVSIGYTASQVSSFDPDHLRLARYDPDTGWRLLDSQSDVAARSVTGTTDHFSVFQVVSITPAAGTLSQAFVYPNPFRPSLGHTRIKFAGLTAGAHVKVFTVSGRLLKELDADSTGQILGWNGDDKEGRALPSGVYLAVVSDPSGGARRTIKFAVQR